MIKKITAVLIFLLCLLCVSVGIESILSDLLGDEQTNEKRQNIIIEEEEDTKPSEPEEPKLVKDETYYFEGADYTVNGIAILFDTITLKRGFASEGYYVVFTYSLENQNSSKATFEFSMLEENCFEYDGEKATLAANLVGTKGHEISYSLEAHGKSDRLIGDFYAASMSYSKTFAGIEYGPIEIGELYTGEEIGIDLAMHGWVNESVESMIVTFEIEL